MGALGRERGAGAAWAAALGAALVISRWALFPRYLVTFDEINFAYSIDSFNPSLHQPQPPGYPVFVALLKIVAGVIPRVEVVFLVAGLLVSAAALALIWRIGDAMAGRNGGLIAAGLLLFNPAFWLSSLTNPVRLCFAAGAEAVAACALLAIRRKSGGWFVAAAASLGIAAGARPALSFLMAPLLLWVAFRIRLGWRALALAALCCGAAIAAWLPATIAASGGVREFYAMISGYSQAQMGGTSMLFGASWSNGLYMAWEAVAWSCLGALSWVWAVPMAARNDAAGFDPFTRRVLLLWFIPGLLFYATFHVGDPDHTLAIVPVTCIAGAIVLTAATRGGSPSKRAALLALSVALNVFLFLKPITKTTKPSTYASVRWLDAYMTGVLEGARDLGREGPLTVVTREQTVGWRNLSYYQPGAHIVVIMYRPGAPVTVWQIDRKRVVEKIGAGATVLPGCGAIAWVDPATGPVVIAGGTPLRSDRPRIFYARADAGEAFEFHGVRFTTAACREQRR